ncbi:MAG: hypothetical protein HY000_17910 [Planctomycetes bacterium]|nr:hypothetical protein [Planctomycetota bacterium]
MRISLGWHFLYQGIWKVEEGDFSSAGFLKQAKGPLAGWYHGLIPDYAGRERLELDPAADPNERAKKGAQGRWKQRWQEHLNQAAATYQFDKAQQAEAQQVLNRYGLQLDYFFEANREDLLDYFHQLDRLEADRASESADMPYQQERNWEKQKKLEGQVAPWLAEVESLDEGFRQDLTGLIKPDQRALQTPEGFLSQANVDTLIVCSNLAIGACLIAGLFTRFAAFSGGLFLLSIVLAQPEWPTIYPPAPAAAGRSLIVNKEFIEMMALFALAATPVGRWGGLDFFVHHVLASLFGKRGNHEPVT